MKEHGRAVGAFLTTTVGGTAFAFVLYLLLREPCPSIAGISAGDCVLGLTLGDFALRAGLLATALGAFVAWVSE